MACGVHKQNMIVRVDPGKHNALLKKPHARPFDITGRPMKGWILVQPAGLSTSDALKQWVQVAVEYASSLPAKK